MAYEDYEYSGVKPDAINDQGYVCLKCGYEPTNRELQRGSCPQCVGHRRAEQEQK